MKIRKILAAAAAFALIAMPLSAQTTVTDQTPSAEIPKTPQKPQKGKTPGVKEPSAKGPNADAQIGKASRVKGSHGRRSKPSSLKEQPVPKTQASIL